MFQSGCDTFYSFSLYWKHFPAWVFVGPTVQFEQHCPERNVLSIRQRNSSLWIRSVGFLGTATYVSPPLPIPPIIRGGGVRGRPPNLDLRLLPYTGMALNIMYGNGTVNSRSFVFSHLAMIVR